MTAIDDFGTGFSTGRLVGFQRDIVKLDMDFVQSMDTDRANWTIVRFNSSPIER